MREIIYDAQKFLRLILKGKRFLLDCGHHWTPFHPLTNTAVILTNGRIICHNCYW